MQLKDIQTFKTAQIRVGSIFKMTFYPKDGVTPKGKSSISRTKYFVIAGIDTNGNYVGVSLINTDVNINFARTIAPFQLCIYPEKYDFLKGRYRYVDCYVIRDIEKSRIRQNAEYIGCLEEDDIEKVRTLLKTSPVMDTKTIKQYNL